MISNRLVKYKTNIRYFYSFQKTIRESIYHHIKNNYSRVQQSKDIDIKWYPFIFNNLIKKPQKSIFSFFKSNQIQFPFNQFIRFLQDPSGENQFIEPKLKLKYQSEISNHPGYKFKVTKAKLLSYKFLDETKLRGVFFHRHLNMKSQNYSFQIGQSDEIHYRLQKKIGRQSSLKLQQQIIQRYQNQYWDHIYIEKYHRFIEKQFILREIVQIDTQLQVKITYNNNEFVMGQNQPTKHLLQLQRIVLPYQQTDYYVTDVDFYLEGNPYTQD